MTSEQIEEISGDTRVKLSAVICAFLLLLGNLGGVALLIARDIEFRASVSSTMESTAKELKRLEEVKRDKGILSWNRYSMVLWAQDLKEMSGHEVPDPNNLKYSSED